MPLPLVFRRKVGRDPAAGFGYYESQIECAMPTNL